jgi:hypothetical protein
MVSGHRKPAAGFSRPDTGLSGNPGTGRLQPGPFVLFVSFVVKKNSGQEVRFHRRERKERGDCRRIHHEEHEETRRLKGYTRSFIRVSAPLRALRVLRGVKITDKKSDSTAENAKIAGEFTTKSTKKHEG